MISITTLLTSINTILLITVVALYLKKSYVVMTKEEFDAVSQFIEEHSQEDEAKQELAGGTGVEVGFGADYLENEEDE